MVKVRRSWLGALRHGTVRRVAVSWGGPGGVRSCSFGLGMAVFASHVRKAESGIVEAVVEWLRRAMPVG